MNMPDHMGSLGYKPMKKRGKWDPGPRDRKRRVKFCKKHQDKDAWTWKSFLQGVGDFSEFTWYPKELHPAFEKLQSDWTYMTEAESKQPAFQRPNKKKKWFPSKEWAKIRKMKVFGLTTSNGKQIFFEVPWGKAELGGLDSDRWASFVRKKLGPFVKRTAVG